VGVSQMAKTRKSKKNDDGDSNSPLLRPDFLTENRSPSEETQFQTSEQQEREGGQRENIYQ
jgi:hypothetical protein